MSAKRIPIDMAEGSTYLQILHVLQVRVRRCLIEPYSRDNLFSKLLHYFRMASQFIERPR
jgi:hypothetical protein